VTGGGIEGTGNLTVDAGSNLTAGHIIQGALVIGGTAVSPAMVTIAASDANGNPLNSVAAVSTSAAILAMASYPQPAPTTAESASAVATAFTLTSNSGVSSTSDAATFLERQTAIVANGNGKLLHCDAVAAAFADSDVLEWAASTPASRYSAADADISLLSDDLIDAIGRQWPT
jgi:hypothetical protein